jgi:phosphotriesterase-related protein
MMTGKDYLDFERLEEKAAAELKELKTKYGLNLFVDCTPINIGRNIELLKRVSEKSGVHIVCSTGFYYTDEPVLYASSAETLAEHMIKDAKNINAGIIKAAVENEALSEFNIKLLTAAAIAQKELNLPVAVHTNANNKNGLKALNVLLEKGVKPEKITIGHLSDTENIEYILEIAKSGCYIGLDRMYDNKSAEYIGKKANTILKLCDAGFEDKIILSHDESFFNGFEAIPVMKENTRFSYIFEYIKPRLPKDIFDKIIRQNPIIMLGL